jgi:hypothetical protein
VPYPNYLSIGLTHHPATAGFFIALLPTAGGNPLLATLNSSLPTEPPMPKHEVTDPNTVQEVDCAHPIPSDPHPFNVSRGQILNRLWEIASMNPEITRNSLVGQLKALSMIVAIEGLIPDRRAGSSRDKPDSPPETVNIYEAEWLRNQRSGENVTPEPARSQEESSPDNPPPTTEPIPAPPSVIDQHQVAPVNATPTPSLAPRVPMADHFAPDTRVPFSIKKGPFGRRR